MTRFSIQREGYVCVCVFIMIMTISFSLTEMIFQSHVAHWWSPDGARLAYASINNTLVPKMELPMFTGSPYPTSRAYHYPKVRESGTHGLI